MRIHFDDSLQDIFPAIIEMGTNNVLDALEGICEQHPLKGKIAKRNVFVRDFSSHLALTSQTHATDIYVCSQEPEGYAGAGGAMAKPGRLQVALAILMVAATFIFPMTAATITSLRFSAAIMAIGGAIAWLSPQPKIDDNGDRKSRYFGGDKTTTKIGTPIQLVFGRRLVFGQLISFDVDALPYNGLEDPKGSPYFKEKADSTIAEANINRFYGIINAGKTEVIQVASTYRTGSQY
jgi:predicted phage tail protein